LDFEEYFKNNKPDLIVDTVDNNKTRALLNYFSLKYNIPFISGGTRYNSGQAVVSVPGVTACLNCKADIDALAKAGYSPQSCILAPSPSVITSNQIIAGLMVDEAERILAPKIYGPPTNKIIKYVSSESSRLGLLPAVDACNCYKDKKYLGKWIDNMKHLYEMKK
jgi:molybdopterin/thiamine biosynthesis adenylyltransferase